MSGMAIISNAVARMKHRLDKLTTSGQAGAVIGSRKNRAALLALYNGHTLLARPADDESTCSHGSTQRVAERIDTIRTGAR